VSKTIVVCCDGTGNARTGVPSNVKRLSDYLLNDGLTQTTTYHEGVGTAPRGDRSLWDYWSVHLPELWFGDGIDATLAELYGSLAADYRPDDSLFLFGFSRGAFTVRALAGMLHVFGLPEPGSNVTAAQVVALYRESEARIVAERRRRGLPPEFGPCEIDHAALDPEAMDLAARHTRRCAIDFMGLWDTVKAYGWVIPRSFPALRHNMSVRTVRHAVALDERRALFQMTGWASAHIDVKEVWFAGDHSDVGGGHESGNSALADASLRWMLGEAWAAGVHLNAGAKMCVEGLEARSAAAVRTRAKGSWQRLKLLVPDCLPRIELDNHAYPPARPWVWWPFGARKPGDHAFGTRVCVHKSVEARCRAGERRYRLARLVRRTRSEKPRQALHVCAVDDLAIDWTRSEQETRDPQRLDDCHQAI
jgi:uncharacterized protein (DUF2235 family)